MFEAQQWSCFVVVRHILYDDTEMHIRICNEDIFYFILFYFIVKQMVLLGYKFQIASQRKSQCLFREKANA